MKLNIPVPYERLIFFKDRLGLDGEELICLDPYRDYFIKKKDEFSGFFYNYFSQIQETRIILEQEGRYSRLIGKIWRIFLSPSIRQSLMVPVLVSRLPNWPRGRV